MTTNRTKETTNRAKSMRLKVTNFVEIRDVDIEIADTYTLIYGLNETSTGSSSNGAGKSLLLESVFFALFGDTLRGFKLSDIVGGNGDTAIVDLQIGNLRIERTRTKTKSGISVWIDGEQRQYQEIKYAQQDIDEWLGATQNHFLVSSCFGEQSEHILDMTPSNRTKKLLDIVGYDSAEHSRIEAAIKSRLSVLRDEIVRVDTRYFGLDELQEAEERAVDSEISVVSRQVFEESTRLEEHRLAVKTLQEAVKTAVLEFDESDFMERKGLNEARLVEVKSGIRELTAKRDVAKAEADSLQSKLTLLNSESESKRKKVERRHEAESAKMKSKFDAIIALGKSEVENKKRLTEAVDKLQSRLDKAESSSDDERCHECGQKLEDSEAKAAIADSVAKLRRELSEKADALEASTEKIAQLKVERDAAISERTQLEFDQQTDLQSLDAEMQNDSSAEELAGSIADLRGVLEALRAELGSAQAELERAEAEARRLASEYSAAKVAVDKARASQAALELKEKAIERAEESLRNAEASLEAAESKRQPKLDQIAADFIERRESMIVEKSGLEKTVAVLSEFKTSLAKFKSVIISRFVEKLEGRLNYFFSEIGSDIYADFEMEGDELNIAFSDASKQDKLLPYKMFSRGERTRLRKAFFWLMVDLFQPKLVLSDESVDGVDEFGVAAIAAFSAKENAGRLYLEASPVKYSFDGESEIQTVLCRKTQDETGATMISVGVI